MSLRKRFIAFDNTLAKRGVPPLTAWWRTGICEWLDAYESAHVLELFACVGRGAAKSTALYKLACFFALFGTGFNVPPGERHFAIVLSRLKEEAAKGISIISRWLTLLSISHPVAGDVIELSDLPRGIRVVAASVAATSGWRAFFVGRDERSKWPSSGTEEGDASEVDTSAAAMTATHAHAPIVSFGSAWGAFGDFYEAIVSGSDKTKIVMGPAPTWVAAPHIREEDTRRKEKDERRWAREYQCSFQASVLGCFDPDAVARAFGPHPEAVNVGRPVMVIDASSGKGDSFAFALVRWAHPAGSQPYVSFEVVDGIQGAFWRDVTSAQVVARIATVARSHGASVVHGDQREAFSLTSEFLKHGLQFREHVWSNTSKTKAIAIVRRWFSDGLIALPEHAALRRELLSFEEKIGPSGAITFGARSSQHDDHVALIVTAALAHMAGEIPAMVARTRKSGGGSRIVTNAASMSSGLEIARSDAPTPVASTPYLADYAAQYANNK